MWRRYRSNLSGPRITSRRRRWTGRRGRNRAGSAGRRRSGPAGGPGGPARRPSRSARQPWRPAVRRASRPRTRMRPHGVVGSSGDRHRAAQARGRPPAAPSAARVRGPRRTPASSSSAQLILALDRKGTGGRPTAGNHRGKRPQLIAGRRGRWKSGAVPRRVGRPSIPPPRRRRGPGGRPGAGSAGRARGRTRPGSRRRSPRARPPG
jgi:hypothetical protein